MGLVEQKMGELLRLERERRQLSLVEISSDLKIPQENLEGIEKGDLSLLPTPVYYGLFARSYSQALGIDYNRTLEAIKEEVSQEQRRADRSRVSVKTEEVQVAPRIRDSTLRLDTPIRKLIGAAAILVLIFLTYMVIDALFLSDGLKRNGASEMLKGVDAERLNALAGFNWDVPGYKTPAEIKIDLKPKSESWSTVMADGDTVIFRRLIPGREYTATAKFRLVVSIGVPEAVDVEINGRLVDLRDPINQRISRVEVNQANLGTFLNPSFDNLLPNDTGLLEQGRLEQDTSSKVTINEDGSLPADTSGTAMEKDES